MFRQVIFATLFLAVFATAVSAQPTIVLVRHAERADSGSGGMGADPGLAPAGLARAASLAAMLKDTKLSAVFSTEFKRTQETAAPTAKAQQLTVSTVPAAQTAALVEKLKAATGTVLVVGHSNTVADIITALGVTPAVTISETEFDNLFVVVTGPQPRMIRLRYK